MSTLEANIFAKINAVVNVSITKLVTVVTNSAGSIGADSAARCQASNAASAEQTALYQTLASGGTTIFGTSFGSVLVSNITQGIATNPTVTIGAASAAAPIWIMGVAFLMTIMAGNT
ncbi:hypothetical protein WJX82_008491 [Trebouxia sp. C0006]